MTDAGPSRGISQIWTELGATVRWLIGGLCVALAACGWMIWDSGRAMERLDGALREERQRATAEENLQRTTISNAIAGFQQAQVAMTDTLNFRLNAVIGRQQESDIRVTSLLSAAERRGEIQAALVVELASARRDIEAARAQQAQLWTALRETLRGMPRSQQQLGEPNLMLDQQQAATERGAFP